MPNNLSAKVQCTGIYVPGTGAPIANPAPVAGEDKLTVSFTSVAGDPVQLGTTTMIVDHATAMGFAPGKTYTLTIG